MTYKCSAISGEEFSAHDMAISRENRARIMNATSRLPEYVQRYHPESANVDDLLRVHDCRHVRLIEEYSAYGGMHYIDMDTYVTGESFTTALLAAGSSIGACRRALHGEHCFALVRPPGHHAEPDRAMGFCLFNNAAVAAAWALEEVDRIAIVDWDLHHGNGTQKIFYQSDRVLFCSIHQSNAFPGTGWIDEIGEGRGRGFTLNSPLMPGSTIEDYAFVFSEVFSEAISHFSPDLLLVSAGMDPLSDDPMEGMRLIPEDFGVLTRILMDVHDGPLALVLEGGYGPSLGDAIAAVFSALNGKPVRMPLGNPRESTMKAVLQLKKVMI